MNNGRDTGYVLLAMASKEGATPLMTAPWTLSEFCSRKLKPNMPTALGLAASFCTIRLSLSPASDLAPSSRRVWQIFLYSASSTFFRSLIHSKDEQPASIANSTKASRVPEVGGGPSTSILVSGRAGLTSFQVLLGLGTSFGPYFAGMPFAKARKISLGVNCMGAVLTELASTMPSKPI